MTPHRLLACLRLVLLAALLLLLLPAMALAQDPPDPCGAGNLIPNCGFDTFTGGPPRQLPNGWTPFILSGDLTFQQHTDTVFAVPSLMMWSNGGTFTAGLYTQVGGLQPGAAYVASIGWGGPNAPDTFGRRLGIDPTGGSDPLSSNVQWGQLHYGAGRILNRPGPHTADKPNLNVSAIAQGPVLTVFVWVEHPRSTGDNYIFLDNVGLQLDPNQPPPSPTAVPATASPVPSATPLPATPTPTATATATASETATPSPSPTPTDTPTATATPTLSPTPTATPSPTQTPTPTPTRRPRPTATPPSLLMQAGRTGRAQPVLFLYAGFVSLASAAGISSLLWRHLRRR